MDLADLAEFGLLDDPAPVPVEAKRVNVTYGLRPYQLEAIESVEEGWKDPEVKAQLICLATGAGKCLGKGTPVMRFDGSVVPVEDIKAGDLLMGPDSRSRSVVSTCSGREMLYRVVPMKGDPYIVNESHIISVKMSGDRYGKDEVRNISVTDWFASNKTFKHCAKGWRPYAIEFREQPTHNDLPPYLLGVWLGDGASNCAGFATMDPEIEVELRHYAAKRKLLVRHEKVPGKCPILHIHSGKITGRGKCLNVFKNAIREMGLYKNKHVPEPYKINSRKVRLELLAGLIDTDGSLGNGTYDFISASHKLSEDVAFISRSLGLAAYVSVCRKTCGQTKVTGTYFRVSISGNIEMVPCRIARKKAATRKQKKSVLRTGIKIEKLEVGEYFGFELSGPDRLFLLGDFTVTHNTITFAALAKRATDAGLKVLILAHTDELLDQAIDKLLKSTGLKAAKEKANSFASRWDKVVVASVQSMQRIRLQTWPKKHFGLVIVDEAHRSLATSYQNILCYFESKVIGVTATADRGDKRALGDFYQRIALDYGLRKAVRDGWLVRPIVKTIKPVGLEGINLEGVRSKGTADGQDFDRMEVAQRLAPILDAIAQAIKEEAGTAKLILFLPSVETAQLMSASMNKVGIRCDYVTGECADRADKIARYKNDSLQAICNMGLLTEGFDHDTIDTLVILRPTKIRSLYAQMVGRGTRPLNAIVPALARAPDAAARTKIIADSTKPHVTILDFLWLYKRHDLITPASLIASDPKIIAEMKGRDGDLFSSEQQAERDLLKKLEAEVRKNANKKARVIDPLAVASELGDIELADYEPETAKDAKAPSEGQLRILEQNGIDLKAVKFAGQANLLINRIFARRKDGLCSIRQMHFFARLGVDASKMTAKEAALKQQEQIRKWSQKREAEGQAKDVEFRDVAASFPPSAVPLLLRLIISRLGEETQETLL